MPKDIQQALGSDYYPEQIEISGYNLYPSVPLRQIKKSIECLKNAKRPLFLLGGGVNISRARHEMTRLVEKTGIPVVTTIMGKGSVPTSHPLYIGNLGIHGSYAANMAVGECDVLFSIGVRFNDRVTGKVSEFAKNAVIIHIDIDSSSISKNITAHIPVASDAKKAIVALLESVPELNFQNWLTQIRSWESKYPLNALQNKKGKVTPYNIISEINRVFKNAVITTDVGQNQLWASQYIDLDFQKQMLTPGGLGTMGFGFPAAIGAKSGNPDKDVITICGDGGIQMNIQEMATAVVYELPVVICIFNNGYLGNVRQWQEMFFEKRYSYTCLKYRKSCTHICNTPSACCPGYIPDFIRLAESYGAKAIRMRDYNEIKPALEEAKNTAKIPVIIEFVIEPEENVFPIVPPGNPLNEMNIGG